MGRMSKMCVVAPTDLWPLSRFLYMKLPPSLHAGKAGKQRASKLQQQQEAPEAAPKRAASAGKQQGGEVVEAAPQHAATARKQRAGAAGKESAVTKAGSGEQIEVPSQQGKQRAQQGQGFKRKAGQQARQAQQAGKKAKARE